jgi:hypothetical protein
MTDPESVMCDRPPTAGNEAYVAEAFGGDSVPSTGLRQADAVTEPSGRIVRLTAASGIRPRRVTWFWEDRIPAAEITLTPGVGGIGKSTFHAWIVAETTRGTLPGRYLGDPKAAIICASEDSWERTIVPRLMAAGADLGRVFRVEVIAAEESVGLQLPADIEALATQIKSYDVALVSLDPLMSLISGTIDTHKDAEVRRALEPLSRLADSTGCSILGNAHFNKGQGTDPMMRLTGSAAFGQVVRSVLAFARDPEDGACVITQAKNNLGRLDLPSLSYRIESVEVDTDDGPTSVGRLFLSGESQKSVQDILADQGRSEGLSARGEAERFLRELLKDGPMPAKDAQAQAENAGFATKTIRTARERICEVHKGSMTAGWLWSLKHEDALRAAKVPLPQGGAPSASSIAFDFAEGEI